MPGDMLGEHYRIERELGHGGMATVYLCTDLRDTSQVAVKVLRPELGSVVTRERFLREIGFVSGLDHPRIPKVIDSGTAGITPYYAMKFIDGESLRDKMNRERRLSVEDVARIAAAIAGPTGYAHARNIIHRDIKPENILLSGEDVYVLDFGVARAIIDAGGERLTRTGITVGTPAYMSPEQVSGKKDVDFRSDIYSLGCVVYEMLAGFPPFSGATPQLLMSARFTRTPVPLKSVRDDVPLYMARAVDKAMEFLPDDRWQSVEAFADALQPKDAQTSGSAADQPGAEDLEATALLEKLRKTFADTYDVHSEMKGGGMSRLFLATDVALRRKVVIKILPPELVSPMMLARFRRESEVTAQLQHPHILPVISAGVKDELVHYIMPFIDGESLRDLLERDPQIPIPFATRLLREMIDALAYAHKFGVIHRDIKPENVLIQDGHAVLADFGIAAALSGDSGGGNRLTGTGMSLGTVGYMAPEQALGQRSVDARSDIYSLGVVGYEIFSGQPPFTGITDQEILVAHLTKEAPSVSVLRADTPPTIAQSIKKAMEKDPANRFQTAAEFRDALDSGADVFTAPIPTLATAPAVTVSASGGKPSKKNLLIGVAAALVIALGGFAWMTLRAKSATAGDVYTVTVVPFNALGSGLELWHEGMVDMLARNLDGAGPIRTVSPTVAIRRYRADSAKLGGGNRNMAESMARAAKADYAIFGTIVGKQNDSVHMRASLVNMSSNTQADFEKSFATPEAATDSFTVFVLNEIQQAHRLGAVRQSSVGSANVSALKAFLQGEQFYRRTSWDSAAVAYARAISFDGKFALALRSAARVAGWQKSGSDSTARELKLRAGQFNHGLSPRDSLLVLADSLSAALSSQSIDSLDWNKAARLFATVDTAAARYPNDPDVWYTVGEARFHNGYGSPVNVSEQQTLDAFDKAIALDSAFAPAYVHPVELGFTLHGAEAGRKYAEAYLALNPTDNQAAGIAILDRIASERRGESAVTDKMLDGEPSDAIMAAWYAARRWPDSAQTGLRLLHAIERKPHSSPTYASDSIRLWNFLPLQLAYRGRLRESYFILGNRPWRLFAELAMLGAIPADTVNAVFRKWAADGIPQAYFAYSWLAQHRDVAALTKLIEKAKAASGTGGPLARRAARYRAASGNAYLSLAKGDTTAAISQFLQLPDTLCIACYIDRLNTAKLLESRGKLKEADSLLNQRLNTLLTPSEILIALERGRIAEKLGNRDAALRAYRLVIDAWAAGDPEVQPMVEESRKAVVRLGGAKTQG
jgi:serine/threonine-protein kinase